MKMIKTKLKTERGASITWALLIFLVCAVVGSAVLVAGTTAAGRMSKLAENEQRYYSVTSMAGLLRDVLGEPITVKRIHGSDSVYLDSNNAEIDADSTKAVINKAIINRMMGWSGTASDWNKDYIVIPEKTVEEIDIEGNDAVSNAVSGVVASLAFYPDGSIVAEVSKDNEKYMMRLNFALERIFSPETSESGTSATIKTDTFQWVLKEARTVESKDKLPAVVGG